MCCGVPLPGVAWLSLPAPLLASAISSRTFCAATAGCTASTIGTEATWATGAKSLSISNGSLAISQGLMVTWLDAMTMVEPSGAALAAASVPMLPPAPARLSMTTG